MATQIAIKSLEVSQGKGSLGYVFSIFIKHKRRKILRANHERIKKRILERRKAERLSRAITPIEWHG